MCEMQADEEGGQGTGGDSGESNCSAIPIEDAGIQEGCGMLFIVLFLFYTHVCIFSHRFPLNGRKKVCLSPTGILFAGAMPSVR